MADQVEPTHDFAAFYREQLDVVLAFCYRRTHDPELAADLAAEVFAAALTDRERYRPERGSPRSWLLGIASHKAADARRRGCVQRDARRLHGIGEIVWSEDDLDHVLHVGSQPLGALLEDLPLEQRDAVRARVMEEREYHEIASRAGVSEQVVRKRVSRGLATMRRRWQKGAR